MSSHRRAESKARRQRVIFFVAALIVAVALAAFFLAYNASSPSYPARQDFTFRFTFQTGNGTAVSFIVPTTSVGEINGAWNTHVYDNESTDTNHYPVYMDPSPSPYPGYSIVHVKSRVDRTYTLGNFFAVWGQPLGVSYTLGIRSDSTHTWQLCQASGGANPVPDFKWENTTLVSNVDLILFYHPTNALGCA